MGQLGEPGRPNDRAPAADIGAVWSNAETVALSSVFGALPVNRRGRASTGTIRASEQTLHRRLANAGSAPAPLAMRPSVLHTRRDGHLQSARTPPLEAGPSPVVETSLGSPKAARPGAVISRCRRIGALNMRSSTKSIVLGTPRADLMPPRPVTRLRRVALVFSAFPLDRPTAKGVKTPYRGRRNR